MDNKKQIIKASVELQKEIAEEFNVTKRTVQSALNFETNSPSARLFRAYALNHGGSLYEQVNNPYEKVVVLNKQSV